MTTPRADRPTAPVGHRTDVVAGRFALEQPIASGGSGTVWTARDLKLDQPCAAKVLRRRDGGDLLRFAREQAVRLRHPHVLTPYSWAAEDEHVVIASELVSGGSLATLSGDWGPLAEPTVVEVVRQLLVALGHVHDVGFVHRDVKPANVLLHATGTGPLDTSLADFGLALRPDDARLTGHGTVIGTPGYLAPEVFRPEVPPGPPQDLYALGQLAGSLLTGVQPDGIARETWLANLRDPALRRTLAALTEADPDARPADAGAALALLADAHGDPVPRTAGGEPVDIFDQLVHLGDDSPATTPAAQLTEVPRPGRTAVSTAPGPASAPGPMPEPAPTSSRASDPAPVSRPAGPFAPPPPGPPAGTPPRAPAEAAAAPAGPTAPRRRPWAIGLAAAVLVAAVATAVTAGVTAGSGGGGAGGGSGATSGATTGPTGGTTQVVEVGATCTWQQENDEAATGSGAPVRCTGTDDGYVWQAE